MACRLRTLGDPGRPLEKETPPHAEPPLCVLELCGVQGPSQTISQLKWLLAEGAQASMARIARKFLNWKSSSSFLVVQATSLLRQISHSHGWYPGWLGARLWLQLTWVCILALRQVTHLSEPQCPQLESGHRNCTNLTELLQSSVEEIYLNGLQIVKAQ